MVDKKKLEKLLKGFELTPEQIDFIKYLKRTGPRDAMIKKRGKNGLRHGGKINKK